MGQNNDLETTSGGRVQTDIDYQAMNAYTKWTSVDIEGLEDDGLGAVLTEIDACGNVVREIGIDATGRVAYKWPSSDMPKRFGRGIFDGVLVNPTHVGTQLAPGEFDELWLSNQWGQTR